MKKLLVTYRIPEGIAAGRLETDRVIILSGTCHQHVEGSEGIERYDREVAAVKEDFRRNQEMIDGVYLFVGVMPTPRSFDLLYYFKENGKPVWQIGCDCVVQGSMDALQRARNLGIRRVWSNCFCTEHSLGRIVRKLIAGEQPAEQSYDP